MADLSKVSDGRVNEGKNIVQRYVKWMFTGKLRIFKILYTCIWVTALATFKFNQFLSIIFLGFLGRELLLLLIKDDYKEDSYLMKMANMSSSN